MAVKSLKVQKKANMEEKKKKEEKQVKKEEKTAEPLSDKERAKKIIEGQIYHFRFLEKALGLSKEWIAKKVGALRFVIQQLEK